MNLNDEEVVVVVTPVKVKYFNESKKKDKEQCDDFMEEIRYLTSSIRRALANPRYSKSRYFKKLEDDRNKSI